MMKSVQVDDSEWVYSVPKQGDSSLFTYFSGCAAVNFIDLCAITYIFTELKPFVLNKLLTSLRYSSLESRRSVTAGNPC